jgi:hypothetical protein
MLKYDNPHVRYAIFTIHGERCYQCSIPLDMTTLEIDHVIPRSLSNNNAKYLAALTALGRPKDFRLESYENWLPSCKRCNNTKRDLIWDPSLLAQQALQRAKEKASSVKQLAEDLVTKRSLSLAVNTIERARHDGQLVPNFIETIKPLLKLLLANRNPDCSNEPMRITPSLSVPLLEVIREEGYFRVVKGQYGIGGGAINPSVSMQCPHCGYAAWNGARCVVCGMLSDE